MIEIVRRRLGERINELEAFSALLVALEARIKNGGELTTAEQGKLVEQAKLLTTEARQKSLLILDYLKPKRPRGRPKKEPKATSRQLRGAPVKYPPYILGIVADQQDEILASHAQRGKRITKKEALRMAIQSINQQVSSPKPMSDLRARNLAAKWGKALQRYRRERSERT